jgi:hypothetical protein
MTPIRVTTYRTAFGSMINLSDAMVEAIQGRLPRAQDGTTYYPDPQSHMGVPMAWEDLHSMPGIFAAPAGVPARSTNGAELRISQTPDGFMITCCLTGRRTNVGELYKGTPIAGGIDGEDEDGPLSDTLGNARKAAEHFGVRFRTVEVSS